MIIYHTYTYICKDFTQTYIYNIYIYNRWGRCARRLYVDSAVIQDPTAANCQGLYNWRSRASCGFSESGPLVLEVLVHTVAINDWAWSIAASCKDNGRECSTVSFGQITAACLEALPWYIIYVYIYIYTWLGTYVYIYTCVFIYRNIIYIYICLFIVQWHIVYTFTQYYKL